MSFTVDIVIAVILLLFLYYGYSRGVSLGLFTIVGVLTVFIIAFLFSQELADLIIPRLKIEPSNTMARLIAFLGTFLVLGSLLLLLRAVLKRVLKQKAGAGVFRLGGSILWEVLGSIVWGVLGSILVIVCLIFILVIDNQSFTKFVYNNSSFCRYVFNNVPIAADLKQRLMDQKKTEKRGHYEEVIDAFEKPPEEKKKEEEGKN